MAVENSERFRSVFSQIRLFLILDRAACVTVMTVLRSREILSTPKPRNVVAEPVTPPKTSEISSQSLSPSQDSGHPEIGVDVGTGSITASESGSMRRISARLAKKVGESVEVASAKRKKVEVTSFGLRGWEADVKLGIENSEGFGNPDKNIVCEGLKDLVGGVTELVKDSEKFVDSVSAAKLGVCCDGDTAMGNTKDSGRRKRRLSMEVNALGYESSDKYKVGKGFLSLRSGKKVVKRQINEENNEESSAVFGGDVPSSGSEEVVEDKISPVRKADLRTRGRLSIEEKRKMKLEVESSFVSGKMKLDAGASSSSGINSVNHEVKNANGSSVSGVDNSVSDEVQVRGTNVSVSVSDIDARSVHRERFRNIARRNATRFAHFSSRDEISGHAHDAAGPEIILPESSNGIEDWPGPFSTAMKIIKDRETNRNGEKRGVSTDKSAVGLKWIPKSQESCKHPKQVPSLQSICLSVLAENADAITSLDFVPDALRHKICWFLCDSRRMDAHFLELLVHGTPTEIRIRDCSWLSEELFDKIFKGCNTSKLTVRFIFQ